MADRSFPALRNWLCYPDVMVVSGGSVNRPWPGTGEERTQFPSHRRRVLEIHYTRAHFACISRQHEAETHLQAGALPGGDVGEIYVVTQSRVKWLVCI